MKKFAVLGLALSLFSLLPRLAEGQRMCTVQVPRTRTITRYRTVHRNACHTVSRVVFRTRSTPYGFRSEPETIYEQVCPVVTEQQPYETTETVWTTEQRPCP